MNAIRPSLHFTAPTGWLNDPHGICWVDGQYHLFYQYNPTETVWSPSIHWGHASSPDLVNWRDLPVALSPRSGEGCWTGATIIEDGRPTIFYTSVDVEHADVGRIAVAAADSELRSWTSASDNVVIAGPPDELRANVFRDPCIFATDDGWTMIVGVGVAEGSGLAVQYTSTNRRSWVYDGVVCSRPAEETNGCWTGSMWECPQLFRVGVDWVLAVSVWDDNRLFYVAAAVGTYDGHTFIPERWSRLTHDEISYAMTSFTDKDARPCVMFWLREDTDHQPDARPWAGALSLPMVISVNPDRTVRLLPHPDVEGLSRSEPIFDAPLDGVLGMDAAGARLVCLPLRAADTWELTVSHPAGVLFTCKAEDLSIRLQAGEEPFARLPTNGDSVLLIVDDGIVEIYGGNGVAVRRIPVVDEAGLSITGNSERNVRVEILSRAVGNDLRVSL